MDSEIPRSSVCLECEAVTLCPIRCLDCDSFMICCENCEPKLHCKQLHKPEVWQGSFFHPYVSRAACVWMRSDHHCQSSYSQQIEAVDEKASELLDTGVFSVSHRIYAESAVDKQFDQQGGSSCLLVAHWRGCCTISAVSLSNADDTCR